MKERYEDAPESAYDLFHKVRVNNFPELRNASIKLLLDKKKSIHQGQVKIGCILRPNDLLQHFAQKEAQEYEGYDYIIILDKVCWGSVPDEDRERVLRHELRHAWFDIESEKDPYKLVDHEITDFYTEIELNEDDPKWRERLCALTLTIYEQQREEAAELRQPKTKGKYRNGHMAPGGITPIEMAASRGKAEQKEE